LITRRILGIMWENIRTLTIAKLKEINFDV